MANSAPRRAARATTNIWRRWRGRRWRHAGNAARAAPPGAQRGTEIEGNIYEVLYIEVFTKARGRGAEMMANSAPRYAASSEQRARQVRRRESTHAMVRRMARRALSRKRRAPRRRQDDI